ncbi:MAG TPA: phosphoribosylformylglycinamidine cyclo-ligase [Actinomycetota bacterium]
MTPRASGGEEAYRHSGVDVEAGRRAVDLIKDAAARARRPEVVAGVGGFAGLFRLGDGRVLVAATDGVGTKVEVARLTGRLGTVGIDLVAMSVNDVLCTGAEPLFFLDYLAVGRLVPEEVAAIVEGVAEGCRRAGCALLGGETAEHPGTLEAGRFDLAGFCVGIVEERGMIGPDRVRAGDHLLGLASSGLHANGFSLVRQLLLPDGGLALDRHVESLGRTLGEELLEPTAIYVQPVLALARADVARAAAHITGGGWHENLPRALPQGLGARVDSSSWNPPPIFELVSRETGLNRADLFSVFNMGIGMVVVVARGREDRAMDLCEAAGVRAMIVGDVVEGTGVKLA